MWKHRGTDEQKRLVKFTIAKTMRLTLEYPELAQEYFDSLCKVIPDNERITVSNYQHNLTSDAKEEDEMLTVEANLVKELYQRAKEIEEESKRIHSPLVAAKYRGVQRAIEDLFGPKCLPDGNYSNVDEIGKDCNVDSSEPKSAEPFKVGDKVKVYKIGNVFNGAIGEIIDISNYGSCYVLFPHNQAWFRFCDLEPYTEPDTSHETPVCENHSDNTSQKEVYVSSNRNLSQELANYDKQFDTILKDGFSKERRLNIAAMMAQAILTRVDDTPQVIADAAFRHADALIAESERRVK